MFQFCHFAASAGLMVLSGAAIKTAMPPDKLAEYIVLLKSISEKTWAGTVLAAKNDPKEIFIVNQVNNGAIN